MASPALNRATGAKPALVSPRVPKLEQTLQPNQRHTHNEQDAAQSILLPTSNT